METNNTKLTNAINFLLFSYFGITLESEPDDIMDKAISKAYKDATQQGAFNTQLTNELKEKIKDTKNSGENLIKDSIAKLIEIPYENTEKENYQNQFNEWHNILCNSLIELYKEVNSDKFFTYGNAQKWVNMTMKYLYLLNSVFNTYTEQNNEFVEEYGKYIDNISEFLHVPIDSYIIESVWDKESIKLPLNKEKLCKNGKRGAYNSEKVVAWSKWKNENSEYHEFQNTLNDLLNKEDKLTPIDWEGPAWITVAKKRKANKK